MTLAQKFIIKLYTKRFLTFLAGAELFFLLIDFLQNQKHLPSSANQILLYIYYQAIAGLSLTMPLTLCFAVINAFAYLSKTNEAMALLSLGFSRKQIAKSITLTALSFGILHIAILSTDAGRSYDSAQAILHQNRESLSGAGLMFKFQDKLVTIGSIDWINSEVNNIRIFEFNGSKPTKMIEAAKGIYELDKWKLSGAVSIEIPDADFLSANAKVTKQELGTINILEGFWPKIVDNISNTQAVLSFSDLIKALWLLKDSDLDTDRLRSKFFSIIASPLISASAVLMLALLLPINSRSADWIKQSAVPSFAILLIWGALMAVDKMTASIAFGILPIVVCAIFVYSAKTIWQKS